MLFVVKGLRRWFHMRSRLVNSLQVLNIQRASEHYLSKIKHSVKYTVDPKQIKLLSIQRHVAVEGLRLADYSWPTRFFCFKWMQMKLTHSINQANYVYCTFSHELQNRMDVFRVELYIYIFFYFRIDLFSFVVFLWYSQILMKVMPWETSGDYIKQLYITVIYNPFFFLY